MQPEEMRSLIQQAANAWVSGNAEAFATLFTSDGEFIVPGDRWVGQAAIQQVAADFASAYSDVKIDIQRIIVEGDQAVAEWHWQETEKATGQHGSADDVIVVDFRGGRISRWREYIDTRSRLKQANY